MEISQITEDLNSVLIDLKQKTMRELRVATYGRVISINEDKTINVQPVVQETLVTPTGSKLIRLPLLMNIPCVQGQKPEVNDYVVCLHLDRSVKNLDYTDNNSYTVSDRYHNINDSIAFVVKQDPIIDEEKWVDTLKTFGGKKVWAKLFTGISQQGGGRFSLETVNNVEWLVDCRGAFMGNSGNIWSLYYSDAYVPRVGANKEITIGGDDEQPYKVEIHITTIDNERPN